MIKENMIHLISVEDKGQVRLNSESYKRSSLNGYLKIIFIEFFKLTHTDFKYAMI
jgi:hypothetical protein